MWSAPRDVPVRSWSFENGAIVVSLQNGTFTRQNLKSLSSYFGTPCIAGFLAVVIHLWLLFPLLWVWHGISVWVPHDLRLASSRLDIAQTLLSSLVKSFRQIDFITINVFLIFDVNHIRKTQCLDQGEPPPNQLNDLNFLRIPTPGTRTIFDSQLRMIADAIQHKGQGRRDV